MFATAVLWAAKKGKPKMAPIELTAPPEQEADEDHAEVDEGAAEAQAHLRPRRASQAVPLHHLVHQPQERAAEAQAGAETQNGALPSQAVRDIIHLAGSHRCSCTALQLF